MKIGNRLTIQFSIIVATILILFSISVYYFSQNFRKTKISRRLTDRAFTTARLLLEVKQVDKDLLKLIDKNSNVLPEELVEIYNDKFHKIYYSSEYDTIIYPKNIFINILKNGVVYFNNKNKDAIGGVYKFNNSNYFVLASAKDLYGKGKINDLEILLVICLGISIIITIAAGKIFSKRTLSPILQVIRQVDNITASNLNSRVNEGNKKDEIALLSITFNNMLERIESAFEMQRNFALNASHELRTPLTSITGQIEITLLNKRTVTEYEKILKSILEDIKSLNEFSNGLLDYAQSCIDVSSLMIKEIRIDELILQIQKETNKKYPQYNIFFNFNEYTENEDKLIVFANEGLLKIAFSNIVNNACKFSNDKSVSILIDFGNDDVILKFIDKGIGIPNEDIDKIFIPFFRSKNTSQDEGFGLGLSLVDKIIKIHNGKIHINSTLNIGTVVIIELPNKLSKRNSVNYAYSKF
jgi:signal transduction histidine kinase